MKKTWTEADLDPRTPTGSRFKDRTGEVHGDYRVEQLAGFWGPQSVWRLVCTKCGDRRLLRVNAFGRRTSCPKCEKRTSQRQRYLAQNQHIIEWWEWCKTHGGVADSFVEMEKFIEWWRKHANAGELNRRDETKPWSEDNACFGEVLRLNGQSKTRSEWCEELGISKQALHQRLENYGHTEEAVAPKRSRRRTGCQ